MSITSSLLTIFELFAISCLLFGPILYLKSKPFRYFARISVYYFITFLVSTALFFLVVWWPFDVQNYRTVRWLFLKCTRCFRIKYQLSGAEHLQSDHPIIMVCNHQSSLDLIGMLWMWPDRGVALMKSSLKYMGLFGISAALSGSIFIDRFNKERAVEAMSEALETIKTKNVKLWVFPEGTRNHGNGMLPFKKGAFYIAVQGKIPIVPVVFSSYDVFYSNRKRRFLSEGFVKIQVLPPISTEGLTLNDVTRLSEETREKMLRVFDRISPEAKEVFDKHLF